MQPQPTSTITQIIAAITSAQTVKAFIVFVFSMLTCYLAVTQHEIPDVVSGPVLLMMGYYFAKRNGDIKL